MGQIFKMKEVVGGSKKSNIEPHAIKDPNTQELLVANNDIKRATLKYCVENLQKKDPDPQVKSLVELKTIMVEEKMKENSGETLDISKDDFKVVTTKFKSKQTKSYDFLIKSGNKYQDAIYNLCKRMINEEEFPTLFRKILLYMIWKQKGPQEILRNNRFIHLKEHYLPRTVEALIVNKIKDDTLEKSTEYQVGGSQDTLQMNICSL